MAQQPEARIVDVDRPEISETFADSTIKISFEGQVWRMEFGITRMDTPKPPLLSGKRYPACRLVLSMNAGLQLHDQLKGIVGIMEKQGLVAVRQNPDLTIPPGTKPN